MATLKELKEQATQLGLTEEQIKAFGNRSKKETYELAIASTKKESVQTVETVEAVETATAVKTTIPNKYTPIIEKLASLTTQEEIKTLVQDTLTSQADKTNWETNSSKVFENFCSALIKEIKKFFPDVPQDLKKEFKGHNNYCAITFVHEIRNQIIESKLDKKVETEASDFVPPKEVVSIDFQEVVNFAQSNLESDNAVLLAGSLAFLTGRRPSEVCCISKIEVVNDYQITVTNIAKKREKRVTQRFPVLNGCADDIKASFEKLRKIKPMPAVQETYLEKGSEAAYAKYNHDYTTDIYDPEKGFKSLFGHLIGESEKDTFGVTRNFYAGSIWHIHQNIWKCNTKDSNNFTAACMGHTSTASTNEYQTLKIVTLPVFPSEFFANVGEIKVKPELREIDLNTLNDYLTAEQSMKFKQLCLECDSEIEKVIAKLLTQHQTSPFITPGKKNITQVVKVSNLDLIIQAMMNHNEKLKKDHDILETEKLYVTISKGLIEKLHLEIVGKQVDSGYLKKAYERNLDAINESNSWNIQGTVDEIKSRTLNQHIRGSKLQGSVKMDTVITSISNKFNAMQMSNM